MHAGTLAVALIFGLPVLVVGGFFLIWAIKILTRGDAKANEARQAEETRLIQELHQGLTRMEARIEALETILLDTQKSDFGRKGQSWDEHSTRT